MYIELSKCPQKFQIIQFESDWEPSGINICLSFPYKFQTLEDYISFNIDFFLHFCLGMLAIDSGWSDMTWQISPLPSKVRVRVILKFGQMGPLLHPKNKKVTYDIIYILYDQLRVTLVIMIQLGSIFHKPRCITSLLVFWIRITSCQCNLCVSNSHPWINLHLFCKPHQILHMQSCKHQALLIFVRISWIYFHIERSLYMNERITL